jgi:phosphohistidine swiveling domain-containing protein
MIILNDFKKHKDWIKIWSGKWSLHFDSHQGFWWTKNKSIAGKQFFKEVMYFYENGITDCWVRAKDKNGVGARLRTLASKNPKYISQISKGLINNGKAVQTFIHSHNAKDFGLSEFNGFWGIYCDYFVYHVSVKYIVDYLSVRQINKFLPELETARLRSESVTRDAENYWEVVAENIVGETSYTKEMILSTTKEEFKSFLQGKPLPNQKKLQNRYNLCSLLLDRKGYKIFTGKEVEPIKKITPSYKDTSSIIGQIAYRGTAKGMARIILNPLKEASNFNNGDILVTGMTRPEFLPIMHKAAAFITDAGGILSHAAITARELKKPCIIGTKIATKILKNGDLVEVDANKGIVKKIK